MIDIEHEDVVNIKLYIGWLMDHYNKDKDKNVNTKTTGATVRRMACRLQACCQGEDTGWLEVGIQFSNTTKKTQSYQHDLLIMKCNVKERWHHNELHNMMHCCSALQTQCNAWYKVSKQHLRYFMSSVKSQLHNAQAHSLSLTGPNLKGGLITKPGFDLHNLVLTFCKIWSQYRALMRKLSFDHFTLVQIVKYSSSNMAPISSFSTVEK